MRVTVTHILKLSLPACLPALQGVHYQEAESEAEQSQLWYEMQATQVAIELYNKYLFLFFLKKLFIDLF